MELRGLFQYLVNQLKKGQGIELVLLQVHKDLELKGFSSLSLKIKVANWKFYDWVRSLFNKWQMYNSQKI